MQKPIIYFYQFEIFAIKAAENKENNVKFLTITSKKYSLLCHEWGIIEKALFCFIWWLNNIGFCIQILHILIENTRGKYLPQWTIQHNWMLDKSAIYKMASTELQKTAMFYKEIIIFSLGPW